MKKPRILITVEGGIIQDIFADTPVDITIKDFDTEGADDDQIYTDRFGNKCLINPWDISRASPELCALPPLHISESNKEVNL